MSAKARSDCLTAPSGTPTDSPRCPSQRPPHPHHPHWRPPSRCTPHPRPPSFPHTFTTLPPPTHRPIPPRRRLTAPIPPDSATGPVLALPSLRRPSTTAAFPRASSPRSIPPHRHLFRPLRRPPSRPVSKCRLITRPSLCPDPSLLFPPVCNTSLFCGDRHTMWAHNPGLSSSPGGRHPLSCL